MKRISLIAVVSLFCVATLYSSLAPAIVFAQEAEEQSEAATKNDQNISELCNDENKLEAMREFFAANDQATYNPCEQVCSPSGGGGVGSLRGNGNKEKIWNFLLDSGFSNEQAAGVLANIATESGNTFSPTIHEFGQNFDTHSRGYGIVQWTWDRHTNVVTRMTTDSPDLMAKYYKIEYSNRNSFYYSGFAEGGYLARNSTTGEVMPVADNDKLLLSQLNFLMEETTVRKIRGATAAVVPGIAVGDSELESVKKQTTVKGASDIWVYNFEVPGDIANTARQRAEAGQKLLAEMTGASSGATSSGASASSSGECGSSDLSGPLRNRIVQAAEAELAKWQSGEMKAGTDFQKYTYGVSGEWCAWFVSWIYNAAGHPVNDNEQPFYANVSELMELGQDPNNKRFEWHLNDGSYTPQPGDIAIYGSASSRYHTNLVISATDPNNMVTIGGNEGSGGTSSGVTTTIVKKAEGSYWPGEAYGYVSPVGDETSAASSEAGGTTTPGAAPINGGVSGKGAEAV